MSMKPWPYCPDDLFCLGGAGDHKISFVAWIDTLKDGPNAVNIVLANVCVRFGERVQNLDVTHKILESPYQLEEWRREIWADYRRKQELDFSDEVSA